MILTEDQVDYLVSVEKERWTRIFFACCGKWCKEMMLVMAMLWSYLKKKVLTTMLIMFLVSQLLIKATYFFYRFNYLVSDAVGVQQSVILPVLHTGALFHTHGSSRFCGIDACTKSKHVYSSSIPVWREAAISELLTSNSGTETVNRNKTAISGKVWLQ